MTPGARLIGRLVAFSIARPKLVVGLAVALAVASVVFLALHFTIRTDLDGLISPKVAWRQQEAKVERAFPTMGDDITVVIDAPTPGMADGAADSLTAALQARSDIFHSVWRPDGGAFAEKEGLLFLTLPEVKDHMARLIEAQPLLGPIAADPSLRGVMGGITASLTGAEDDPGRLTRLSAPIRGLSDAVDQAQAGKPVLFYWRRLLQGDAVSPDDLRDVIRISPKLDYSGVEPGAPGRAAIQRAVAGLDPAMRAAIKVRVTGSVPMADDELMTLGEATGPVALLTTLCMIGVLWIAVRSARLIVGIAATVVAGLLVTGAVGLAIFGRFNLISVAFMPLFVGLGVDFAIQFGVRLRAVVAEGREPADALVATGRSVGASIGLAAVATALAFFAFMPTSYRGVSELGVIAGLGMLIAFLLTLTLLPALCLLLGECSAQAEGTSVRQARRTGAVRPVLVGALVLAVASAAVLPMLKIDFDPLALRNQKSESVATFNDLGKSEDTTPNTLDVLAPSVPAAAALAGRLATLPEVARAVSLSTFVPPDQPDKLVVIADAKLLLDTTLNPFETAPAPSDGEIVAGLRTAAARLNEVAAKAPQADAASADAAALAVRLSHLADGPASYRSTLQAGLMVGFEGAINPIRKSLEAEAVTLDTLPPEITSQWRARDGQARIEIGPKGDPSNPAVIDRFIKAVRVLAPHATGTPVTVREAGNTILTAFLEAAGLSLAAISVLLMLVLRSGRTATLTLTPVFLSLLLTLATCALIRQSINLENIIAFPLLLGIGVSFNIYLVIAWRDQAPERARANLARAILFSTLTTATAFVSLALSAHRGTSSLGVVLLVSLGWTLLTALVFQPALLAIAPRKQGWAGG